MLSVLTLYAAICLHKNIKQDMVLYMTQYAILSLRLITAIRMKF